MKYVQIKRLFVTIVFSIIKWATQRGIFRELLGTQWWFIWSLQNDVFAHKSMFLSYRWPLRTLLQFELLSGVFHLRILPGLWQTAAKDLRSLLRIHLVDEPVRPDRRPLRCHSHSHSHDVKMCGYHGDSQLAASSGLLLSSGDNIKTAGFRRHHDNFQNTIRICVSAHTLLFAATFDNTDVLHRVQALEKNDNSCFTVTILPSITPSEAKRRLRNLLCKARRTRRVCTGSLLHNRYLFRPPY